MLKLYDIVKLKNERPDLKIKTNNIGVVVDVLKDGEAYTVEFTDENGVTIENSLFVEFKENELEKA